MTDFASRLQTFFKVLADAFLLAGGVQTNFHQLQYHLLVLSGWSQLLGRPLPIDMPVLSRQMCHGPCRREKLQDLRHHRACCEESAPVGGQIERGNKGSNIAIHDAPLAEVVVTSTIILDKVSGGEA